MRDITLEEMSGITNQIFIRYVEPLAETMMTGEVPSVALNIHLTGTQDSDWLAKIKFRNSAAVSVFHCDVYLEDLMRLCRKCKIYLITLEVFSIAVLYYMIHPLYQIEWINGKDLGDYESMMLAASKNTCRYIKEYYPIQNLEEDVLDVLKYWMMVFTNRHYGRTADQKEAFDQAVKKYTDRMMDTRRSQFVTARRHKAQTYLVDRDGFIALEKQ